MASNQREMINTLAEVADKGIFSFVAVTTKDALKKSRYTKEPTPENLETITVVRACTVSLGHDYETLVNSRLVKEGKDAEFAAGGSYCFPYTSNRLVFKHHEKDAFYLRVYPNIARSFKSIVRYYDANGTEIPAEEFKCLEKEYFAIKGKGDSSQGLDDAVLVNNYKLENVKYLKRGDIIIDELDMDIIGLINN
jgi:hypothetical protein